MTISLRTGIAQMILARRSMKTQQIESLAGRGTSRGMVQLILESSRTSFLTPDPLITSSRPTTSVQRSCDGTLLSTRPEVCRGVNLMTLLRDRKNALRERTRYAYVFVLGKPPLMIWNRYGYQRSCFNKLKFQRSSHTMSAGWRGVYHGRTYLLRFGPKSDTA